MKTETALVKHNPDAVPEGKRFSHAEWRAYEAHKKAVAAGKEGVLSSSIAGQMFEQFLNGSSCTQIAREWRGFQLGAIVSAAINNSWFDKRQEYLDHLHGTTVERAKQIAAESVEFTGTLLAVAHKQWGEKLRRYLATGNESELDGFQIRSIDQYRKVIQTFLELTGHKPSDFLKVPEAAGSNAGGAGLLGPGFDLTAILSTKQLKPEHAAALLALVSANPLENVPVPVLSQEKVVEALTVR